VAGQQVVVTDTSTGFSPTGSLTRDWDLDGDGAFDDASGPTATRSFAAGEHDIALRVRQSGTLLIERVARTRLTVTQPPSPTPEPTRNATPAPDPSPPAAEPGNQAPRAALALGCHKVGGTFLFCPGLTARIGASKSFDATPSGDPDGSIARYEWDLDGNGSYERDTGTDPKTGYVYSELLFRGRDKLQVGLRVTDDKGAAAERRYEIRTSSWARSRSTASASGATRRSDSRPSSLSRACR
jgi:hypothetical protein